MHEPRRKPGYEALRRSRSSVPGAEYFLTANLERPGSGLESSELTSGLWREMFQLQTANVWKIRTLVVMPDHFHMVGCLGERLLLSDCMRLLKGRTSPNLRTWGLKWQDGYYDHLMRSGEDRLPTFQYVYLNPYRAKLIGREQKWTGYYCDPEDWEWFGGMMDDDLPQPEWLK